MDDHAAQLRSCMYQYSRAIYRSIKDLIDPYASRADQLEYRRAVLVECEQHDGAARRRSALLRAPGPRALRRHPPLLPDHRAGPGRLDGAEGVGAATSFIEQQVEAGLLDGGVARCHATTRKGKACQRTPLPGRDYCPSHQHLEHVTPSRALDASTLRTRSARAASSGKLARDVARRRQADPAALAGRVPDGGAPAAHRAGRQVERRGLQRDVRRGVRAPVLLGPRGAHRARRSAPIAARRVHGRGAVHASLRELLPRSARSRRRRARSAPDGALLPRGEVRVRGAAPARAPEPRSRPRRVPRAADGDGRARPRQRARLLARARRSAREARVGDLEAANRAIRLLEPAPLAPGRANR